MTDTALNAIVSWEQIRAHLPRIQLGEDGQLKLPVIVQELSVEYDLNEQEFVLNRSRFGMIAPDATRNANINDFEDQIEALLTKYYQGDLVAAVRYATYHILQGLAEQLPYPQDCQCQKYPEGQALDCHVHMDNPRHFVGHFDFACTCHQQMER